MKSTEKFLFASVSVLMLVMIGDRFNLFPDLDAPKKEAAPAKPAEKPKFKKYTEVITDKAESHDGIFKTHKVDDKYYFEIPADKLGTEFVWLTQYEGVQANFGYGGVEVKRRVVSFDRLQDSILLRNMNYNLRANDSTPEAKAVAASNVPQILSSFKIATEGENGSVVIDVTPLYTSDIHEWSPKDQLNAASLDKGRTFITEQKTFEKNIETKVLATFKLKPSQPAGRGSWGNPTAKDTSLGSVTVELHHSLIELPERPMLPRLWDERVGFFNGSHINFSDDADWVRPTTYVRRWRLEKQDPTAEVSEPVKPIIYYVGRGMPEKWRKWAIQGIEMWQPAFEKAGFKNAIIGKLAPTEEEDPDFDAEDVRYSTIRWLPSTIPNAYGPHVEDPRTGEILEADVRVFQNVIQLIRNWYFVQASPSDPEAQQLPLPDDLMGRAFAYVIAHEVGHTLGMRHNMISTNSYPVEKYRDTAFTAEFGTEASIMDYGRFNYIAQPGDDVRRIPIIGPYDFHAINWAYRQFDGTATPDEDKPFLNEIAAKSYENPMLRFAGGYEDGPVKAADPRAQSEDLGHDAIKATEYGLKNLEYLSGYLVKATSKEGEDYALLDHMYGAMLGQMSMELNHVVTLVGGIEWNKYVYGTSPNLYVPTDIKQQRAALKFVIDHGFKAKDFLLKKEFVSRLGISGVTQKIARMQLRLLNRLTSTDLANRIQDMQVAGYDNLPMTEILTTTRDGLFADLKDRRMDVSELTRILQRAYVGKLISNLTNPVAAQSDLRATSRGLLMQLKEEIDDRIDADDQDARTYHYVDLMKAIDLGLEGKQPTAGIVTIMMLAAEAEKDDTTIIDF